LNQTSIKERSTRRKFFGGHDRHIAITTIIAITTFTAPSASEFVPGKERRTNFQTIEK
jgi:hypothetical protein